MESVIVLTDGYFNEKLLLTEKIESISKTREGMAFEVRIGSDFVKTFSFEHEANEFYKDICKKVIHYNAMKHLPNEAKRNYNEIKSLIEDMYQALSDNNIPIPDSYYNFILK